MITYHMVTHCTYPRARNKQELSSGTVYDTCFGVNIHRLLQKDLVIHTLKANNPPFVSTASAFPIDRDAF